MLGFAVGLFCIQSTLPAQPASLENGQRFRRELATAETHDYSVSLRRGDWFRAVFRPYGIHASIEIRDPAGSEQINYDTSRHTQIDTLPQFIAQVDGVHRIQVRARSRGKGSYDVRISIQPADDLARASTEAVKTLLAADPSGDRNAATARQTITRFEHAVELARQAVEPMLEAHLSRRLGVAYLTLGELAPADRWLEGSLAIFRRESNAAGIAAATHDLATHRMMAGERRMAIDLYRKAFALRESAGDAWGAAQSLTNLGLAYHPTEEPEKQLEAYSLALTRWRHLGDVHAEATTLHNIAETYLRLGDYPRALEYCERALPLHRANAQLAGETHTLSHMADAYRNLGQPQKSLNLLTDAVQLARKRDVQWMLANTLVDLAQTLQAVRQPAKAIEAYEEALAIRLKTGNRGLVAQIRSELGIMRMATHPDRAKEDLTAALQTFESTGNQAGRMQALAGLALLDRKNGHLAAALARMETALGLLEKIREKVPGAELRASLLASRRDYHDLHVDLLMELHRSDPRAGHAARAFAAVESGRARGLLDLLAEAGVSVEQGIAPELRERELRAIGRLSNLSARLLAERSKPAPDANRIRLIESETAELDAEADRLQVLIRASHRAYADLKYPKALSLHDVQSVLAPGVALAEYALTREASYLFVVTRSSFAAHRLAPPPAIEAKLREFREMVGRPGRREFARYRQVAASLYQMLLGPAESLLARNSRLVIVPDGVLHYLPFEALTTGGETAGSFAALPYLARRWSTAYAPSATVYARLVSTPGASAGGNLMALGNPLNALAPRLPAAENEARTVAAMFGGARSTVLLGLDATEHAVKFDPRVADASVLHFAAHGVLDDRPRASGLLLAAGKGEDGLLQAREIFNLRWKASLAVLSACDSGSGTLQRGEGVLALTRAFLYAGAEAVAVSLWRVEDLATSALMQSFYDAFRKSGDPVTSLRKAKLTLIANPTTAHPYYWAPFVLVGGAGK
ncbi:MAG: CHAT domain-containing protein [Acidobacteria bacterium]|nr:CHAT domain-containing protein [Acidobacteriota bacterium]